MVGYHNQGVPTTVDLENNSNQKKYTVNDTNKKGLVISRALCALMAIGAFLLAVLVGLLVFFFVPRYCNGAKSPEALIQSTHSQNLNKSNISNINNNIVTIDKSDDKSTNIEAIDDADERLPRSIKPSHYRIKILPDFDNFTTSGSVTMTLMINENTNDIIFHIHDISILENTVNVTSTKSNSSLLSISNQKYLDGDKYRITLEQQLKIGEEYVLYLEYNGELNRHLQGFYSSQYHDTQGRTIASTQFSPTDARKAFPCFDEPSFKAKFTIILGRPSHMITLSNMPLFNSTVYTINSTTPKKVARRSRANKRDNPVSNDWYWDEYPETPKMSTYLVAFMVVSNFKYHVDPNPLMKFWARENLESQTSYASQIGPKILNFYENYLESKFPLKKIDIVALPSFGFNAMENWGLITFRESSLLYDPSLSTNEDKRLIAVVLAHELAHQWFGNLVTPKFWNDLWLKEGLANYMQYMGVNYAEPKWKFKEEFVISETLVAMQADAFESSRPISLDEVKNSRQIRELFDPISYSKGAALIKMMNNFLGEEAFKEGLISFLKKYQYDNADRQNLFDVLTEEAHKNEVLEPEQTVKNIMDAWAERPGYPVINVIADYEQQKLTISQKRFYFRQKDEKSSWWVPISFTSNSDKSPNFTDTLPTFWLKGEYETEKQVNITYDDWYLLNLGQTGYFIVNYDERNWKKLSANIMEFPPEIRAQLIADSMDLARANLLNYDIPLTMIANMAIQDSNIMFIPTWVAFNKLIFLNDMLSSTPAFGLFKDYHKNIFQDAYKKVIPEDTVDDYITRRIRTMVLKWTCDNPDSACTYASKTSFRNWIANKKEVEPNLRSIVYCAAIREGGEIEWNFAYQKYTESTSATEKNTILDALGCTRLKWLLSRYVDKLLDDPSISIQDADRLFGSVAKNKVGTQIAFDFLRKNWEAIIKHHGSGFNIVAKMVKSLGSQLTTEFELSELIRFRDSIKGNLSSAERAFEMAIDAAKANVEWMEKNYIQVEKWLQDNKDLRARFREKWRYMQDNRLSPGE